LAVIWENWKDPASGEWIRTFAVITTDANELVADIHDRIPLILAPENYQRWLGDELDPADLMRLRTLTVIGAQNGSLASLRLSHGLAKRAIAERLAVFHRDGVGLLRLLPLDRLPLEEPVYWDNAPAQQVRIPERGQRPNRLALGIDRFPAAARVVAPVRDQAPAQRIKGHLARAMVTPDDQQVLARRGIPPRRIVVNAGVPHVHTIDEGIPKGAAALDDPSAHAEGCSHFTADIPRASVQRGGPFQEADFSAHPRGSEAEARLPEPKIAG
jgi:SOS response associated peptidase (SRAP)